MTRLGWSYDQFMDSTFYFYFGVVQQWLLVNGAKERNESTEPVVTTLDKIPGGYW